MLRSTTLGTPGNTHPGFTPGPWFEHSHRQIGPEAGIVCEVWSALGATSEDAILQADANCRLIAAAPAMYKALRDLLADMGEGLGAVRPKTLTVIRAALAIAEGGE